MAEEQKYVVLAPHLRQFTKGDVASASALAWEGADAGEIKANAEAMVATKAVREASEWEAQLDRIPVEHVTKNARKNPPKEIVELGVLKGTERKPMMAPPGLVERAPAPEAAPTLPASTPGTAEASGEGKTAEPAAGTEAKSVPAPEAAKVP